MQLAPLGHRRGRPPAGPIRNFRSNKRKRFSLSPHQRQYRSPSLDEMPRTTLRTTDVAESRPDVLSPAPSSPLFGESLLCLACDQVSLNWDEANYHYYMTHGYLYSCCLCYHQFDTFADMHHHKLRAHRQSWCVFCRQDILHCRDVNEHMERCHQRSVASLSCADCGLLRFSAASLAWHSLFCHRDQPGSLPSEREIIETSAQLSAIRCQNQDFLDYGSPSPGFEEDSEVFKGSSEADAPPIDSVFSPERTRRYEYFNRGDGGAPSGLDLCVRLSNRPRQMPNRRASPSGRSDDHSEYCEALRRLSDASSRRRRSISPVRYHRSGKNAPIRSRRDRISPIRYDKGSGVDPECSTRKKVSHRGSGIGDLRHYLEKRRQSGETGSRSVECFTVENEVCVDQDQPQPVNTTGREVISPVLQNGETSCVVRVWNNRSPATPHQPQAQSPDCLRQSRRRSNSFQKAFTDRQPERAQHGRGVTVSEHVVVECPNKDKPSDLQPCDWSDSDSDGSPPIPLPEAPPADVARGVEKHGQQRDRPTADALSGQSADAPRGNACSACMVMSKPQRSGDDHRPDYLMHYMRNHCHKASWCLKCWRPCSGECSGDGGPQSPEQGAASPHIYPCRECPDDDPKVCEGLECLVTHLVSDHGSNSTICTRCPEPGYFLRPDILSLHVQMVHGCSPSHLRPICGHCFVRFDLAALATHYQEMVDQGVDVYCIACSVRIGQGDLSLVHHVNVCAPKEPLDIFFQKRRLPCGKCKYVLPTEMDRKLHRLGFHDFHECRACSQTFKGHLQFGKHMDACQRANNMAEAEKTPLVEPGAEQADPSPAKTKAETRLILGSILNALGKNRQNPEASLGTTTTAEHIPSSSASTTVFLTGTDANVDSVQMDIDSGSDDCPNSNVAAGALSEMPNSVDGAASSRDLADLHSAVDLVRGLQQPAKDRSDLLDRLTLSMSNIASSKTKPRPSQSRAKPDAGGRVKTKRVRAVSRRAAKRLRLGAISPPRAKASEPCPLESSEPTRAQSNPTDTLIAAIPTPISTASPSSGSGRSLDIPTPPPIIANVEQPSGVHSSGMIVVDEACCDAPSHGSRAATPVQDEPEPDVSTAKDIHLPTHTSLLPPQNETNEIISRQTQSPEENGYPGNSDLLKESRLDVDSLLKQLEVQGKRYTVTSPDLLVAAQFVERACCVICGHEESRSAIEQHALDVHGVTSDIVHYFLAPPDTFTAPEPQLTGEWRKMPCALEVKAPRPCVTTGVNTDPIWVDQQLTLVAPNDVTVSYAATVLPPRSQDLGPCPNCAVMREQLNKILAMQKQG